jgi:hypothetical protein
MCNEYGERDSAHGESALDPVGIESWEDTNLLKKGDTVMADMNETAWIEANVEAVDTYLKKEFENFAIAHRPDTSRTHTFTVDSGKKLFKLFIGWSILANRHFTPARIDRLLKENVADEMRLHGEDGYHWTPSPEDTTQREAM